MISQFNYLYILFLVKNTNAYTSLCFCFKNGNICACYIMTIKAPTYGNNYVQFWEVLIIINQFIVAHYWTQASSSFLHFILSVVGNLIYFFGCSCCRPALISSIRLYVVNLATSHAHLHFNYFFLYLWYLFAIACIGLSVCGVLL